MFIYKMAFDITNRLKDVEKLVEDMESFQKAGWMTSFGVSNRNDNSRLDDLVSREVYQKDFPDGINYTIQVERVPIVDKKTITSLPEISPGKYTDSTACYRLTGIERVDGKITHQEQYNIVSEHPYFDAMNMVVDSIAAREAVFNEVKNEQRKNIGFKSDS